MERNAIENLMEWKASEERKAMVLKGVRQVGNNVKLEIMISRRFKAFIYKGIERNHFTLFFYMQILLLWNQPRRRS